MFAHAIKCVCQSCRVHSIHVDHATATVYTIVHRCLVSLQTQFVHIQVCHICTASGGSILCIQLPYHHIRRSEFHCSLCMSTHTLLSAQWMWWCVVGGVTIYSPMHEGGTLSALVEGGRERDGHNAETSRMIGILLMSMECRVLLALGIILHWVRPAAASWHYSLHTVDEERPPLWRVEWGIFMYVCVCVCVCH